MEEMLIVVGVGLFIFVLIVAARAAGPPKGRPDPARRAREREQRQQTEQPLPSRDPPAQRNRQAPRKRDELPTYHWTPTGHYTVEVVGESNYQWAIARIAGNHGDGPIELECIAVLLPEDKNRYDKNAVRILMGGYRVGYLARHEAPIYRERLLKMGLEGAVSCNAFIGGGAMGQYGDRLYYGVWLDLAPLI